MVYRFNIVSSTIIWTIYTFFSLFFCPISICYWIFLEESSKWKIKIYCRFWKQPNYSEQKYFYYENNIHLEYLVQPRSILFSFFPICLSKHSSIEYKSRIKSLSSVRSFSPVKNCHYCSDLFPLIWRVICIYLCCYAGKLLYNMIKDVEKKFVFLIFNCHWNITNS
jgi:hypothetical protein